MFFFCPVLIYFWSTFFFFSFVFTFRIWGIVDGVVVKADEGVITILIKYVPCESMEENFYLTESKIWWLSIRFWLRFIGFFCFVSLTTAFQIWQKKKKIFFQFKTTKMTYNPDNNSKVFIFIFSLVLNILPEPEKQNKISLVVKWIICFLFFFFIRCVVGHPPETIVLLVCLANFFFVFLCCLMGCFQFSCYFHVVHQILYLTFFCFVLVSGSFVVFISLI